MSFLHPRSSAASNCDRLSYIHGPEQVYSNEYIPTFGPRKNLNELFQSICEENVRMENLRVYLRVRPSLPGEVLQEEDTKVELVDDRSIVLTAPASSNTFKNSVRGITKLSHKFTFTHIYGPSTTQEGLFQSSTLGLVTDFVSGQNCLLFTYGATNSGKTFTVQGTASDAGLLPRTLQHIFNTVGERQYPRNDLKPKFSCNVTRLEEEEVLKEEEKRESIFRITSNLTTTFSQSTMSILNSTEQLSESSTVSHNTTEAGDLDSRDTTTISIQDSASPGSTIYAVFVSFAEIYNEYIFDLLEKMPTSKTNKRNALMLGEDRNGAIYIKGLNEVRVRSADEALQLLDIGRQNLHFAATRLNHNSSRSHCIFTIKLVRLADADCPQFARVSVLSLCDLAGAERAAKTLSTQDRLKESGNINTSLLTLSRCIEALRFNQTQKSSKKVPVPYRDSKLTRLFQSFLLGRGKAAMIVNISKMPLLFDETLQVLKFSAIAKQVAISQAKESEIAVVQPSRRVSRLSKMVRQSLKGNGRLSVPWGKATASITFGESGCEEKEGKKTDLEDDLLEEDEEEDDDDEENEQVEALLQLIARLKDELVREHKEKQDLEERLRQELCKEFSQQLVKIQNAWRDRLRDQESRYEEYTENKIQLLMKSVKKNNKRMRSDEDPDEEYVPSIFLFREQRTVEEQKQRIEELEGDGKLLEEEIKALKESQRKTNELATKAQEENSRLTFRLAQLTGSYDKVVQELKEAQSLNTAATANNTEAVKELKAQLEARTNQLAEQDQEIQELQNMLLEASECYTIKEKRCASLEKILESSQITDTQQLMHINELESQLEGARSMLSQQAAQVEEREQDIEDLRQLLSQERKTNKGELEKMKQEVKKMEEDHIREKSKLLLEMAGLKMNRPLENGTGGNTEELRVLEEKVSRLQKEKETLKGSEEALKKKWEQEAAEKDEQIKLLERTLALTEKKLSEKEEIDLGDEDEKEAKMEELEKKLEESNSCQKVLKEEKEAQINRMKESIDTLSGQLQTLKASEEDLSTQLEETKCSLKEKEDAELELQENLEGYKADLEELQKVHRSLKENKEEKEAALQENYSAYKADLEELQRAHTTLKEEAEQTEAKLQESLSACRAELQELQKAHTTLEENNKKMEDELQESLSACKTELAELQKAHTSLKEKEQEKEAELQKSITDFKAELKELQEAHTTLMKENESLQTKLQDQINVLDKVRSEAETEIKAKDEDAAKNSALCDELRAEIEEMKKLKDNQENTVKEVSELGEVNARLEAQMEQLKEEKTEILARVEMLEVDKKKMGERLYTLQEANLLKSQQAQAELQTLEEQNEILIKEKEELEVKLKASHRLTQEKTSLVKDKQDVILALSSKIESLDAKLSQADQDVIEKSQLEKEFEAARENIIRLETKCDLLEKEIRALREARQAEVQESFNRTRDHEDFVRQKDMEISTLQQEVKKLLQQSMTSSRGSISEAPPAPPVKAEVLAEKEALQVIREQLRLTEAHNSTLLQEVSSLRTQVVRQSTTSDTSVLQLSTSKSAQKKQREASTSDMETFITPVPKEGGRGRKARQAGNTPNPLSQMDSSVGDTRQSREASPSPSSPRPAPTSSSGRPQRSTRRTMRYDSQEYELGYKMKHDEGDLWEPNQTTTKGGRRTTRGQKKSKVSELPKTYLQDQENKSSMANKADVILEAEDEPEPKAKTAGKKAPSARRRRALFDPEDAQEPFLCTPDKAPEVQAADSPLTLVRRQLRTKRK